MKKGFFKNKLFVVLILICLFFAGFGLSAALGSGSMPSDKFFGFIMTPFNSAVKSIGDSVSNFFKAHTEYEALLAENEDLRTQLSEMRMEADKNSYLSVENENLKKLLNLSQTETEFKYISADAVSYGSNGGSNTLQLNEGTAAGVEVGDVVLSCDGLLGTVASVGYNWCEVKTVYDTSVSVGIMVATTHDCGIMTANSTLTTEGLCKLEYIDKGIVLGRGDRLVTSGLGGVFPEGIPVGTVEQMFRSEDGSAYATVKPYANPETVDGVYVITEIESGVK